MYSLDIDITLNSGQVFLWERIDGTWFGVDGQRVASIKTDPSSLRYSHTGRDLFRLDDDYTGIILDISRDDTVRESVTASPGLRLLRQDPFQCCISFIVSTNSNIQKIRESLRRICRRFGDSIEFCGHRFHLFPTPERLASANMAGLLECGLGYRAPFVRDASKIILDKEIRFDSLYGTKYDTARDVLLGLPGVGSKVADCVMLFSLEKLDAFPLDRWTVRILRKYYTGLFPLGGTITPHRYEKLHQCMVEYFGPHAGYAQQFLFKMERDKNQMKW